MSHLFLGRSWQGTKDGRVLRQTLGEIWFFFLSSCRAFLCAIDGIDGRNLPQLITAAAFRGLTTRPPNASLRAMEATEMKQPFIPVISVGPFYVRFPRLTNLPLDTFQLCKCPCDC